MGQLRVRGYRLQVHSIQVMLYVATNSFNSVLFGAGSIRGGGGGAQLTAYIKAYIYAATLPEMSLTKYFVYQCAS